MESKFCNFKHEGIRNQFSEHFRISLYMNLVPSTSMHVLHDKYDLLRPKDLQMRAMTTLYSNFYSFSMYFVGNP
jgi:hypothetical protein